MIKFLLTYFSHKNLYFSSITLGVFLSQIISLISKNTPENIFGTSITLWSILLIINLFDIHTGIKADTSRRKKQGENFVFESYKGWRAIEKIFVFTVIIGFLYYYEKEWNRLYQEQTLIFSYIKMFCFFYIALVELQSIGENQQERYGYKSKLFLLLDNIIELVNTGIKQRIKNFINPKTKDE